MLNMQHHVTKNACSAHRLPTDIAYPTGGKGGSFRYLNKYIESVKQITHLRI